MSIRIGPHLPERVCRCEHEQALFEFVGDADGAMQIEVCKARHVTLDLSALHQLNRKSCLRKVRTRIFCCCLGFGHVCRSIASWARPAAKRLARSRFRARPT